MDFKDYYAIVEKNLEVQNPTSADKLERLTKYCAIEDGCRVLDVGCGKAWLLRSIARAKAVTAVGIEINPLFVEHAQRAIGQDKLKGSVEILQMPALSYQGQPKSFDVTFCIGASFALGSFQPAIDWLSRMTVPGGHLAIGEPFARQRPFPESLQKEFADAERSLAETVGLLAQRGLHLIGLIAASLDDWDRYESAHWRAADAFARAHPSDPRTPTVLERAERSKRRYLEFERNYLDWAIFVCRVAPNR